MHPLIKTDMSIAIQGLGGNDRLMLSITSRGEVKIGCMMQQERLLSLETTGPGYAPMSDYLS